MSDANKPSGRGASAEGSTEDFLYHLYRGSELLADGRLDGARTELDRAMRVQPRDPAAQDVLAKLYFRLGVYPRAIELYMDVLRQLPDQIPPRINVALAFLKTGQMRDAVAHLLPVIERDAGHKRAWGYLGLAWSRLGEYAKAREAFARAGHDAMARRMDEELSEQQHVGASVPSLAPASIVPEPLRARPSQPPGTTLDEIHRKQIIASVVAGTFDDLDPGGPDSATFSIDPGGDAPAPGTWSAHEPGDSSMSAGPASEVVRLAEFARMTGLAPRRRSIENSHGVLVVGGGCLARVDERTLSVGVIRGDRSVGDMPRTATQSGVGTEWIAIESGWVGIMPTPGMTRRVLELRGESVTLRPDLLVAFEHRLERGSCAIDADGKIAVLSTFAGEGLVAFETSGIVRAVTVRGDAPATVPTALLVGWTGAIDWKHARETGRPRGGAIEIHGQGIVLLHVDAIGADV